MTLLDVAGLRSGYHGGTVLHGLSLRVDAGEAYAVVGHNGAGKTTLVHTLAGFVPAAAGTVRLAGRDATALPPHRRARLGLGLVPQGRRVFASLTVAEHLAVAHRRGPWTPARVLALFPQLAARRGHRGAHLSGGEQQMLAVARALLTQPALLLLDEPTEGLAPAVAEEIAATVTAVRGTGTAVLLTAPGPDALTRSATTVAGLSTGRLTVPSAPAPSGDPEEEP